MCKDARVLFSIYAKLLGSTEIAQISPVSLSFNHCLVAGQEATKQWYDEISKYSFASASGPGTGKAVVYFHN